jgi:hypothetical protein
MLLKTNIDTSLNSVSHLIFLMLKSVSKYLLLGICATSGKGGGEEEEEGFI